MPQNLAIDGKAFYTVRIKISPSSDFRRVIHALDCVEFPSLKVTPENLKFAVLELVNNSVRAHREREEERDITVDMTAVDGKLHVAVRDFGGGFDPGVLPYSLESDPSTLDVLSESFLSYQKRNAYRKFGMGILVAKRTSDRFQLVFLDENDTPVPWDPERVAGTLIRMELGIEDQGNGR